MHDDLASILAFPQAVRAVEPGIYSSIPEAEHRAAYDRKGAVYDAIVGRSLYHRFLWGTTGAAYTRFAQMALAAASGEEDWFVEIGCGSLLFTASLYRRRSRARAVLVDRSLPMLRRGARRLGRRPHQATPLPFFHGDASRLPFRGDAFTSVLSLNLLHVPCDAPAIVSEIARLLIPGSGRLFASSLVRVGRWSDGYARLMARAGELAPLRSVEELRALVARACGTIESMRIEGNMCFLVARRTT
jgi:SAM-dependent methyltransferase